MAEQPLVAKDSGAVTPSPEGPVRSSPVTAKKLDPDSRQTVGVVVAAGLCQYLKTRGSDGKMLLKRAGLPCELLEDRYARIPVRNLALAFDLAARDQNDPEFGLHFGEWYSPLVRFPCNFAINNAPDLRSVLACLAEYRSMFAEIPSVFFDRGEMAVVSWNMEIDGVPPRHVIDFKAMRTLKHIRKATGPHWVPLAVSLAYERPDDISEYNRLLGPSIKFGQTVNSFYLEAETLDTPVPDADPDIFNMAHNSFLEPKRARLDETNPADQVRRFVGRSLDKKQCTLQAAARHVGMTTQQLGRTLKKHDTCFQCIVTETRRSYARHYLVHTDTRFPQIAHMLGFSDQSAFTRAVKRWFGQSPKQVRRQARD